MCLTGNWLLGYSHNMARGFDIIGDPHGRYDPFIELVGQLGYSVQGDGSVQHKDGERQIIVVGDLINKGSQNRAMLDVVRASVFRGTMFAVMGNHEFFTVCYARRGASGEHIIPHNPKTDTFLKTFLDEFPLGSQAHTDAIDWMAALPLYVQKPGFIVVHAMHNDQDVMCVQSSLDEHNALRPEAFEKYAAGKAYGGTKEQDDFFWAMERLLFGASIKTPEEMKEQGYPKRWRVHWWEDASVSGSLEVLGLKDARLDEALIDDMSARLGRLKCQQGHALQAPDGLLVHGHYSLPREPGLTADRSLCVDFQGADKRGVITAYRFNEGDTEFYEGQLESVDAAFDI